VTAVQELFRNQDAGWRPVGFIDDDPDKHGRIVNGIPVLGGGRDLERLIAAERARCVIVSTSFITAERMDRCAAICKTLSVGVLRLDLSVRGLDGSVTAAPGAVTIVAAEPLRAARETDMSLGAQRCPSCGEATASRSRARNAIERFRKRRTDQRLYRCEPCGWRGWLLPLEFTRNESLDERASPDLRSLDQTLVSERAALGPPFDPARLK
jgi:predicted RNA-binding Zn-ribbon protein involved in translation (DUF1610 family)